MIALQPTEILGCAPGVYDAALFHPAMGITLVRVSLDNGTRWVEFGDEHGFGGGRRLATDELAEWESE